MTNVTNIVTGFTYHAYPGQSGLAPNTLTDLLLNSSWLRNGILTGSGSDLCLDFWGRAGGARDAGMELWVTEASSSWAWNLPPPAQNSFIHGFFTIPELGQYANTGVGMVGRWSFSEQSPFGLIIQNGTRWDVASDYFVLYGYKQTIGSGAEGGILTVAGDVNTSDVLVYAHCAPSSTNSGQPGAVTVMAVNPTESAITLTLTDSATGQPITTLPRLEYVLTAPNGNLSSTTPILNGNAAAPLRINDDGSMPPFQPNAVTSGASVLTLPPQSQAYFVLTAAGAAACPAAASAA